MILTIAVKEFRGNLISSRFVLGFLLCLFLIPFSLFVSIGDYESQVRAYEVDKKAADEGNASIRVYSALRPVIVRPPESLSIFSRGISDNIGGRVQILLGEKPFMTTGKSLDRENPFLNAFSFIDFIGVISVVMSLVTILFSYDLCSREREQGTLKLMLSNAVGRGSILIGKMLGAMLTLLPIIVFCYILCAVIVLLSPHVSFSIEEWWRVVLLFVVSSIYVTIFMVMGMFVSTRTRSSATSVVICLFAWVLFVFIIPNLSVYTARSMIKGKSEDNLRVSLNELDKEFKDKVTAYRNKIGIDAMERFGNYSGYIDGGFETSGSSLEYMDAQRRVCAYSEPLRIEYADKKWVLQKQFHDTLDRQRKLAETLSLASPAEQFRLTASALCNTDANAQFRFLSTANGYREDIISFLSGKNLFSSYVYFTRQPQETFMPIDVFVSRLTRGTARNLKEYEDLIRSPGFGPAMIDTVLWKATNSRMYAPLDLSIVPSFQWKSPPFVEEMKEVFVKLAGMILVGLVLFYLSFVSFVRYDVR